MGTCDRCGPMVPAQVQTVSGLTFCGHCARTVAASLPVTLDMRTPETAYVR